jgi:hypothetical protein
MIEKIKQSYCGRNVIGSYVIWLSPQTTTEQMLQSKVLHNDKNNKYTTSELACMTVLEILIDSARERESYYRRLWLHGATYLLRN